ncbi:MAG: adenylate/guanylate cyclase domain-containing protein [Proteobacteria bacterium]|nr:adenylate/guanylate cyclase domain-containing protein [Pseudomonadota bacterium]
MKPSIQFVKRKDGVRIAYSQFGKGPPLVCPSPWVTSLSYIFEDRFAKQFWTQLAQKVMVVSYDKHGCGQSDRDRKDFTLESELLDLETVIGHLGLGRFSLMGSSMAGPIAIEYIALYPEKVTRLILYGSYANGKDLAPDKVKSALVSLVRASWGLGSKTLADIFLPGANTEELQSIARFQKESSSPEIAAKIMELCYSLDVTKLLSGIKIPTLILHREGDKACTIDHGRQLAAEIPNAQFKVLKGKIHPWWYGETGQIIEEISEFIGGVRLGASAIGTHQGATREGHEENMSDSPMGEAEVVEQTTIVFSDIVSSTALVTKLGDAAARDIFLQHDKIVRDQIMKYGGRELQNLGDGFMLSFASASEAIKCACNIQKEISKNLGSIKVRMGINAGEVVRREGKHPFGQAVVVASRIAAKAKGGQILISDVTRQLASGSKFLFVERGRFKPKGFDETIKLHEIDWEE